jgi:hypothetical protein
MNPNTQGLIALQGFDYRAAAVMRLSRNRKVPSSNLDVEFGNLNFSYMFIIPGRKQPR